MHNNEINNKPINLFVYGTLAPGRPNEHILSKVGGTWEKASIKGKLKEEGWGAEMGYPGVVLGQNEEKVKGLLAQILEQTRGKLEKIGINNPDYDADLAKIGKEEKPREEEKLEAKEPKQEKENKNEKTKEKQKKLA